MNKSLSEFLRKRQILKTAEQSPYTDITTQRQTPYTELRAQKEPTSFMGKVKGAFQSARAKLQRAIPFPIKSLLDMPQERDLYKTDRDYRIGVEYDRLKEAGMSDREAGNVLEKGVDTSFGTFGATVKKSAIPEKYRDNYLKSKENEVANSLFFSSIGFVAGLNKVPRKVGERLALKYGDKAAAQIVKRGKSFAEKAAKEGGEEIVKRVGIRFPNNFGAKITPKTIKNVKKTIPEIQERVAKEGAKTVGGMKEGQKVSNYTAQLIKEGKLDPNGVPSLKSLAKKYELVDERGRVMADELAHQLEFMMSEGGKTLNIASQWGRQLNKELKQMGINTIAPSPTIWKRINNAQRGIINFWRASLVSQLSTSMRNLGVFGYRYSMNVIDDAMQGAYLATTGKEPVKKAFGPAIEDILAVGRQLGSKNRKKVMKALEESPALKTKLFQYSASDVAMGNKATNAVAFFTRTQSYFQRTLTMNSKIGQWARQSGKSFAEIKPEDIPVKVLREGIDTALKFDFAQQPNVEAAKSVMKLFHDVPILNAITYPFPRYMSNAVRNIYEFSPLAYTKFFSPKALDQLAKGNRASLSAFNKATIGTVNYVIAHRIRNSEFAGEKWYEIKHKGKTYDMRPFGPFLPTYMFVAEAIKTDGKDLGPRDWLEGMLGMNRMAGTSLFMASQLSGEDSWETFRDKFKAWAGEFIGGFGQPAMTAKDFFSMIDDEERIVRYTKEDQWLGPFKSKIPILSQTLPETPTMTRDTPFVRKGFDPVLKQTTGLLAREKNFLESEIDRLGIKLWQLKPKTGDAWIDRKLTNLTGDFMQLFNDGMEQSENYANMADGARDEFIRKSITESKKVAKQKFFVEYEEEVIDHYLDKMRTMSKEERAEYIGDLKNKALIPENITEGLIENIELFSN